MLIKPSLLDSGKQSANTESNFLPICNFQLNRAKNSQPDTKTAHKLLHMQPFPKMEGRVTLRGGRRPRKKANIESYYEKLFYFQFLF